MKVFTVLETSGEHGNVFVNEIKNGLTELKVYPIFPFLQERSIFLLALKKFANSIYKRYCTWKARSILGKSELDDWVFLSFGGDFAEYFPGKTIVHIDDCYFTEKELSLLKRENVLCIIVTTNEMRRVYIEEYGINKPIYVIPAGVRVTGREKQSHNGFNVLYYGHIINSQEIKIFNAIQEKMKNKEGFKLTVAGSFVDGVSSDELSDGINFLGHISHEKVLELLKSTDLGLYVRNDTYLMSLRLSAKTIEMMSFGVPIIATESRHIPDGVGWSIPKEQIPDRVLWCYEHPEELIRLSENAKEYAKRFELPNVIAQYRKVINTIEQM